MNFGTLTLTNFRCFHGVTVDFATTPGLRRVTGVNAHTPNMGPNGVGKSSIFDGLCWTVYGQTARGLKAVDVGSWHNDAPPETSLTFGLGGESFSLRRKKNQIELSKGRSFFAIEQKHVDDLIGYTFDEFLATCYLGQFNRFFFDLAPAEKLNVFASVMNLSLWSDSADAARDHADLERGVTADHATEVVRLNAQLKELTHQRDAMKTTGLKNLLPVIAKHQREVDDLSRTLERAREDMATIRLSRYAEESRRADAETARLERQEKDLVQQWQELQMDRCPTCGHAIHANPDKLEHHKFKLVECQQWLKAARAASELAAKQHRDENQRTNKAYQDYTAFYETMISRTRELDGMLAEKERIERATGEWDALDRKIHDVKHELARRENARRLADVTAGGFDRAQAAFKNVRLWTIEGALHQLELETANCLEMLGLRGWKITFAMERVTGKGTTSRGFNVFIESPTSGGPVKWECWSGGETQRLRIAGAIGVANLIRSRKPHGFSIEVWDEPTAHLSSEGIGDLLEFFSERSAREGKSIWVVDHRSMNAGIFDGGLVVTKGKNGSTIANIHP